MSGAVSPITLRAATVPLVAKVAAVAVVAVVAVVRAVSVVAVVSVVATTLKKRPCCKFTVFVI